MTIPYLIAKKIEERQEMLKKAKQLEEEISTWFLRNGDYLRTEIEYSITADPRGEAMDNGEFDKVDGEPSRDNLVHGKHYYPIEGSDSYVMANYWTLKGGD